jgi:hypothetical protein
VTHRAVETGPLVRAVLPSLPTTFRTVVNVRVRGSAWYRTELVRVWVRRAIQHAARHGGPE